MRFPECFTAGPSGKIFERVKNSKDAWQDLRLKRLVVEGNAEGEKQTPEKEVTPDSPVN